MPLEQGHEPEELRMPPEPVTRNVHGQSLEDAQETFRAEWEARLREKRLQAARARDAISACQRVATRTLYGGMAIGALLGCALGINIRMLLAVCLYPVLVGFAGFGLARGVVFFVQLGAWLLGKRAERLERELRELERA